MSIHRCKLTQFDKKITSGNEKVFEPKNFITKYNKAGTPKPKLYTITTPYRTSSSLNIYSSLSQFEKYLDKLPVELSKNMIVVKIQNGP